MPDYGLNALKTALEGIFDRVLDLFDGINISEHRNETLCFAGVGGYKLERAVYGGNAPCEVVFSVRALGSRTMSAVDLSALFDEKALPAIEGCGLDIVSIKRQMCAYSKEQQRHEIFADVTVNTTVLCGGAAQSVGLTVDGEEVSGMSDFRVERKLSVGETPTLESGIKTRVIGEKPMKITAKGVTSRDAAAGIYSRLAPLLGAGIPTLVAVSGMSFGAMILSGLSLYGAGPGFSGIELEFCGVNEA